MIEGYLNLTPVKVTDNIMLSPTSGLLRFKRNFSFQAGQVIGMATCVKNIPRLYSIASSEYAESVEILYKIITAGELTPQLKQLRQGNELYVSPPFGNFIAPSGEVWFVAAGTGIAPFISMIKSGRTNNITLIHGSREHDEFFFSDYLLETLKDNYIKCYTGRDNLPFYKGRVTGFLSQISDLNTHIKYYLCGSAEMVVESREILIRRGIPFHNIRSEIYF
jgi:ferredoxin--NADP+ reductase